MTAALVGAAVLTWSLGPTGAAAKGGVAGGVGGTAKPPAKAAAPLNPPIWPAVPAPTFSTNTGDIHGFSVLGFISKATVDPTMCPDVPAEHAGGTVVLDGVTITVPCNSVVQMPANTLFWPQAVDIATHNPLALDGSGANGSGPGPSPYPSFEARVEGNVVGDKHVAGLVFLSQQAANAGAGVVTRIDYATGNFWVGAKAGAADQVMLQINDPKGRFGRAQSPDDRFSVDDANPTIHSGTGYPMCIPRTDPAGTDDPLCPQKNRPSSTNDAACRNFTMAGVALPASGELSVTPIGQRCTAVVFPDPNATLAGTDPDARQQAPIEVGDWITYSGTLFKGGDGQPDFVSVHTLEDSVGLYTQPGTLPSYLALGEFRIASGDPTLTSVNGAAQEVQDRLVVEAETTDVKTAVDIYLVDRDPKTGAEVNRWVTPFEMTGENHGPPVQGGFFAGSWIGGGITTQNTGAQNQRVRLRANRAPAGLLGSPTRMLRVVTRTQCLPPRYILNGLTATSVVPASAATEAPNPVLLDGPPVPAIDSTPSAAAAVGVRKPDLPCVQSTPVANGLTGGVYSAPVFDFIFPENVKVGDPTVPYDFWDLGFLANGEGPDVGPLEPRPW